ncbi:MAG: hypothetical protein H7Z38_16975 [Rubrivivax sp.]|nr:hypothetical protein [Pyrinomonadaceae bacterium]
MDSEPLEDELIVKYLLGESEEEEMSLVERRYFDDDQFHERLAAAEEELIDAYLAGALGARERKRFEAKYLADATGRERVASARRFLRGVELTRVSADASAARKTTPPAREGVLPLPRWHALLSPARAAPAYAITIIVFCGVLSAAVWWLLSSSRHATVLSDGAPRSTPGDMGVGEKRSTPSDGAPRPQTRGGENGASNENTGPLAEAADKPKSVEEHVGPQHPATRVARRAVRVASFVVMPGMTRGGGAGSRVELPPDADTVNLLLSGLGEGEYKNYRAVVSSVGGGELLSREGLVAREHGGNAPAVELRFPARLLEEGDYILHLSGHTGGGAYEEVQDYFFRVLKK